MPTKSIDTASTSTAIETAQRLPTLALAAALSLGSAIALGFARFAYALLLPSMKLDLGWSFAEAGAMNTANALGYLLGGGWLFHGLRAAGRPAHYSAPVASPRRC
jgi:predicted MFS family arabinose efflux permease